MASLFKRTQPTVGYRQPAASGQALRPRHAAVVGGDYVASQSLLDRLRQRYGETDDSGSNTASPANRRPQTTSGQEDSNAKSSNPHTGGLAFPWFSDRKASEPAPQADSADSAAEVHLPVGRSKAVVFLMVIGFAGLIVWAFYLQVISSDFLRDKGEKRYLREIIPTSLRGRILDRSGNPLAVNTPMYAIWASPGIASTITRTERSKLAALVDLSDSELQKKLSSDDGFVYLQRKVTPEIADQVIALNLPGIHRQQVSRRYYPNGEIAAHVVGTTNNDGLGIGGAETVFQEMLKGQDGYRVVIKDKRGKFVEDMVDAIKPINGHDVTLSLDANLQYIAYTQLKQAVEASAAKAGSAIVIDSKSGEILALVNAPSYDPNGRGSESSESKRNRALTDVFEPGSTLKPFTAALALDQGLVKPDTSLPMHHGKLDIDGTPITDTHFVADTLTVKQIIQHSSNIGAAQLALKLKSSELWAMYEQLGFGVSPHLGFPNEAVGLVRPWQQWRRIDRAIMGYGHGISVSLVQLARAYLPFARDGDTLPLSLLRVDTPSSDTTPLFSRETAQAMREMLEKVVSDGTAKKATISGYRVGGKTGTAYKVERGRYVKKYVSSFVGIAPISSPRLIVGVVIDEPTSGHYGGEVAAPVFAAVMGSALRNMGIPQDAVKSGAE